MLPIDEVLPQLLIALAARCEAVLVAPPGAGKTTRVPLALMDAPFVEGRKLILLEPRRLAARSAAARMAEALGEPVGETVGFRVRLESNVSARTRIEVVTEGVFTRMIQTDPGLEGVAAVLFDEFHERSLDADLGLALARHAQSLLRPDMRLLVMSATLDGAKVAALLGDAPIIESEGRAFPVETQYLGRDPSDRLEGQIVRVIKRALDETQGGLLVFLPGQAEIRRVEALLGDPPQRPGVRVVKLYGALSASEQAAAIAPPAHGERKIVLATSIAETSLTLQGIRVVIDSGLARVPRFDPASGLTRLETVRVSRAAADQRRGRAGRSEPGLCYRLWDEAETRGLMPFARPEILEAELSGLALDLARWGTRDPAELAFLDPPPTGTFGEACTLLMQLGALDGTGTLTPHGRRLSDLPLPPRLAHMVLRAATSGQALRAALIAAVLTEPGLGGRDVDVQERLRQFERDGSPRAQAARGLARRWARAAEPAANAPLQSDGALIADAWPDRLAKARSGRGSFQLMSGRMAVLDETEPLARAPWLAIAELGGGAARDRIQLAASFDEAEVRQRFARQLVTTDHLEPGPGGRIRAVRRLKLGRLVLEERPIDRPDPERVAAALIGQVREHGLESLPFGPHSLGLRNRAAFLKLDTLSDARLLADLESWLLPLLPGPGALEAIADSALANALASRLTWDEQQRLDREAPAHFLAPTGSRFAIDYGAEGGPRIEVRVQELFGLTAHPVIGPERIALILALLSPAHRPIQITRDLPAFWRGSWREVKAEMKGRYPRHPWPDDPAQALPTTRAKPRT